MFIKTITLEGTDGDVEIRHTDEGAEVIAPDLRQAVTRASTYGERWAAAWNATTTLCGVGPKGEPIATASMVADVLREIERVAGIEAVR
jgi:hypothetical protein